MKTVLIIAGSDPGAGAGLQQDLKTVTLLGAYGLTVPTALTVQNSLGVQAVHPVSPEVVAAQLEAVLSDFPVDAVKVGMLATAGIVGAVASRLQNLKSAPLVLDPVLAAGGGFPLLDEAGIEAMQEQLFPLTRLLTPNVPEAARLTGLTINATESLEDAARRLQALGPQWVLAKGGHLPGEPVDILTDGKNAYRLPGTRLNAPQQHGTGCLLAAAAAAGLAQGLPLPEAVQQALRLTRQALKYGLPLGRGSGPVNPYAPFARDLARFAVLQELQTAAARLQAEDLSPLVPEVMSNLGFALPYPEGPQDVAAFPGRLVKTAHGLLIPAGPAFGASKHIAALLLAAAAAHPDCRSAMNIRHLEGIEDLAPLLHLRVVSCDPDQESGGPPWNFAAALPPGRPAPDLVCRRAGFGREPMLFILGTNPSAVAEKALAIMNALQAGRKL